MSHYCIQKIKSTASCCRLLVFLLGIGWANAQILDDSTKMLFGPSTTWYVTESDFQFSRLQMNSIDTNIHGLHEYNFIHKMYDPQSYLGNLGTATQPLFRDILPNSGMDWGYNVYDQYFLDQNKIRYYSAKSPFTGLNYVQGAKNEQYFKGSFSRNIKPWWNAGFDYQRMGADKKFGSIQPKDNQIDHHGFVAHTWIRSNNHRYNLLGNYSYMRHLVNESGGVVLPEGTDPDALFEGDIQPVNLYTAQSTDRKVNWHLTQSFDFGSYVGEAIDSISALDSIIIPGGEIDSLAQDTLPISETYIADSIRIMKMLKSRKKYRKFRIYHTFDMGKRVNKFDDNAPNPNYYNFWQDSIPSGTIQEHHRYYFLENRVGFKILGNNSTLRISGVDLDIYIHDLRFHGEHNDTIIRAEENANRIGFALLKPLGKSTEGLMIETSGEMTIAGYQKGRYYLLAGLSAYGLYGKFIQKSDEGTYLQNYYSGKLAKWENTFEPQILRSFEIGNKPITFFKYLRSKMSYTYSMYDKYIYFYGNSYPAQYPESIHFSSIRLDLRLDLKKIHFDNYIVFNQIPDSTILRIIPMYVLNRVYYKNVIFNRKLPVEIGLDFRTMDAYYADNYNPIIQQFYIQDNFRLRPYTAIDVFINFRIRHSLMFMKFSHINEGWFNKGYFSAPYYPAPGFSFEVGLNWRFFD